MDHLDTETMFLKQWISVNLVVLKIKNKAYISASGEMDKNGVKA